MVKLLQNKRKLWPAIDASGAKMCWHSLPEILLLIILFLNSFTLSKIFNRCELFEILKENYHLSHKELVEWTCLAKELSDYNSSLKNANTYGLFQIKSEYSCINLPLKLRTKTMNLTAENEKTICELTCEQLLDDDINDDFKCARFIYNENLRIFGDGFYTWNNNMNNKNISSLCGVLQPHSIDNCFKSAENNDNSSAIDNYANRFLDDIPLSYIRKKKNIHIINEKMLNNNDIIDSSRTNDYGKIYDRCELAKELYEIHNMPMEQIPTWVCIAKYESHFNTSAVGRQNGDRSLDHGLFQISDLYWCSHDMKKDNGKGCALNCQQLLDNNLIDDILCIQRIYREHSVLSGDGFNAWSVYKPFCRNQEYEMISNCFEESANATTTLPIQTSNTNTITSINNNWNGNNPFLSNIKPLNPNNNTKDYEIPFLLNSHQQQKPTKQNNKIYTQCSLAQELYRKYHFNFKEVTILVCIADRLSGFNTAAIGGLSSNDEVNHSIKNTNGLTYGLFQISDKYWCSNSDNTLHLKSCGILCDKLTDSDISDDIECARIIYDKHLRISGDGFNAWTVYQPYCKNRNFSEISSCFRKNEITKYYETNSIQSDNKLFKSSVNPFLINMPKNTNNNNKRNRYNTNNNFNNNCKDSKLPIKNENIIYSSYINNPFLKLYKNNNLNEKNVNSNSSASCDNTSSTKNGNDNENRKTIKSTSKVKSKTKSTTATSTTSSKPNLSAWSWLLPRLTLIKPKTQT